jgi:hypothetical protein
MPDLFKRSVPPKPTCERQLRLSAADDRGVEHLLILNLASNVIGFLDKAVHGWTVYPLRVVTKLLENLIKSRYLVLGFSQMVAQTGRQLPGGGLVD